MFICGDIHGRKEKYVDFLREVELYDTTDNLKSIALGELGFKQEHDWFINSSYNKDNKILFGNHDYFPYLNLSHSLGRYKFISDKKIFCIAGGYSIDRIYRKENLTWFADEQMNISEEKRCFNLYKKSKPEIVLSHDGPESIIKYFFNYSIYFENERTTKFLELCLKEHRPKLWIFAHHHKSKQEIINGTKFICLNELETIEI